MDIRAASNIIGAFLLLASVSCEKQESMPGVDVFGHAGTSIYGDRSPYPANTKESVLYALDVLDADGVEVDVQMTRDSVLVLYHDGMLDDYTRMSGCIPQYNYAEIEGMKINGSKYELALLSDVMTVCAERNKALFLDMKPYNYCTAADVDHLVLNNALNKCLSGVPGAFKNMITINTRNAGLLNAVTDTVITKSFETENTGLGSGLIMDGTADELCIKASALSSEIVAGLKQQGIPFSVFGVKTPKEIRNALRFVPGKIITDNIAYTRKMTK